MRAGFLTFPALRAAGSFGLRDDWGWEGRWCGFEGRRRFGRRVYHSSSSRSVESDDIVRENSTAVGLVLCGRMLVLAALSVTGPTGSSSVPPTLPLGPLSEAARKEKRPGDVACVEEAIGGNFFIFFACIAVAISVSFPVSIAVAHTRAR
jgi:hypothetical protein